MATLTMPRPSKSGGSATVLRWFRKPGDAVSKGDVLLEAESDDGLIAVESAVAGTLQEVLAPMGKTLSDGALIAVVGDVGSSRSLGTLWKASLLGLKSETTATQPSSLNAQLTGNNTVTTKKAAAGNVTPILMPKAGQSMEEGVIVKWHVQPGAQIKQGTVIFEIETDKATMEVEATDSGRLSRIIVPDGGSSAVLKPVAYLADNDADVDAFIAAERGAFTADDKTIGPSDHGTMGLSNHGTIRPEDQTTGRVKASPAARKVAGERGIDISSLGAGSGPGGRILSSDVPKEAVAKGAAPAAAPVPQGELSAGVVRKRMSSMRKAIARNLSLSKTTIPHWYLRSCVNAGSLMSFYRSQKAKVGCSVNDVIVMACARAIMEFPLMHSRVDGETISEFPGANIGIAVGMDDGLVVPVLMNAEKLTLADLAVETKRLANQARAGKIENMGQGVFTISNLGMYGVDDFVAIVNPPEAAIMAVGAVHEAVIVKDGALRAGQQLNLTLSADHRLIDGTLGAQFMAKLKALLEDPFQLIA